MNKLSESLKALVNEGKVVHDESRFHVPSRVEAWIAQAPNFFDDDLDKLKAAMLRVFKDEDPQYNLETSSRIFAKTQGEKPVYSGDLRKGLAVSLALVGNYNKLLTNCSKRKRTLFVAEVMHDIFSDMTWKRLATLDDILPFFAEADPDAFISEMDNLAENKVLFGQLVDDEGGILEGGFHWHGIVDALETLAWEQEYLVRVIALAAKLSLLDKESNMHPRPKDVLVGILWPWHPQTRASTEKIIAAAKVLVRRHHKFGWNVLSCAITSHTGSLHRLPKIRKSLPDGFDTPLPADRRRGMELIKGYEKVILEIASTDVDLSYQLAQHLGYFKSLDSFGRALKILSSQSVLDKDDEFKERIWTELRRLCVKHRAYRDAKWAMPAKCLKEIECVIEKLIPQSLLFQRKYLFDNGTWDWYESDDYTAEEKKFKAQRISAVREIFAAHRISGIFELLKYINNPVFLGEALCFADINLDNDIIVTLLSGNKDVKSHELLSGYLWRCLYEKGEGWLASFRNTSWGIEQKADFLCCLPFVSPVWHFCEEWLGEHENLYWQRCRTHAIPNEPDPLFAVDKALKYSRPDLAVECLFWNDQHTQITDFDICARALLALVESDRMKGIDNWHIVKLICGLQKQPRSHEQNNALAQIEFLYLPLLDSNVHDDLSPVTLDSALAEDPAFFHQVLTFVYKSDDPSKNVKVNEWASRNAFNLLFQWKKMPGVVDGALDYDTFIKWYDSVIELCTGSGRLHPGQTYIGHILIHTPADPSGFWIDKRIAALLDKSENQVLRDGYYTATYNSRGVQVVDMSGKKDLDLAEQYKTKAGALEDEGFLTFAQTLRDLAKTYIAEAEQWQKEGERLKHQDEL